MTQFLASVRNLAEARIAFDAGADIIDLKEPALGALGAAPLEVTRAVVAFIARRKPVSATIGDLPMRASIIARVAGEMADTGVDFIKVGLFKCANLALLLGELGVAWRDETRARRVAVLFADHPFDFALIKTIGRAGFCGVMLDTADKSSSGLRRHVSEARLRDFVRRAHAHDLLVGFAGSLRAEDIAALANMQPDYLGFRGALCECGERGAALSARKVAHIAQLIRAQSGADPQPEETLSMV